MENSIVFIRCLGMDTPIYSVPLHSPQTLVLQEVLKASRSVVVLLIYIICIVARSVEARKSQQFSCTAAVQEGRGSSTGGHPVASLSEGVRAGTGVQHQLALCAKEEKK